MSEDYDEFLDCLLELDYEVLRSSTMPVELSQFLAETNNAESISTLLYRRYQQDEVEIQDASKVLLALLYDNQQRLEDLRRFFMNAAFRNEYINFDCFYDLLASYIVLVLSTKISSGEHTTTGIAEELKVLILAFKPSKDGNSDREEEYLLKLSSRLLAQSRDAHSECSVQGDIILDILCSVLTNFSSNTKTFPILSQKQKLPKRLHKWLRKNMKRLGILEVSGASQAVHIAKEDSAAGNDLFVLDTFENADIDRQVVSDGNSDGDGDGADTSVSEVEMVELMEEEPDEKDIDSDSPESPTRSRKSENENNDVSCNNDEEFLSPKKESAGKRKADTDLDSEVSLQKPSDSAKKRKSPKTKGDISDQKEIVVDNNAEEVAPKSAIKSTRKQKKSIEDDDSEVAGEKSVITPKSSKKSGTDDELQSDDEEGEENDIVPPLPVQLPPHSPPRRRTRSMSVSSCETPTRPSTPQVGVRRSARKRASSISSVESASQSVASTSTPLRRSARKASKRANIS